MTSLFMLGISSNRKWSHNIASQSTGGSGRDTSRRKSEAGVIGPLGASQHLSQSVAFLI